ncbi:MAG: aspartate carbamoyltransferase catalytic subunit [Candidatus Omnitrophica bacterium]|nr:aspartate carbamoyltransferase catalytic subunit [Candidatus Omnitrophota bacterium]
MNRQKKKSTNGFRWERKHLLGIAELSTEELALLLDQAENFREVMDRPIPKVPALRGKTIVNLFCEPSTRTRTSFELAAKRLSADTLSIATSSSSFIKGESLKDTARNIEAMQIDMLIIRHSTPGAPKFLSECIKASVVNAGDGSHEHPTQALLDVFTIRRKLKKIVGLNVSIVGDIAHSRVAKSNIFALKKLGAEVTVCGPKTMMPSGIESLGVKVTYDLKEALKGADAVNVLRIQAERQNQTFFPGIREYARMFGITKEKLNKYAKKEILLLHPGPINRGVELSQDAADGEFSVILDQVTNGVAVRMAVLFLLSGIK